MKSINYGPLTERKTTSCKRARKGKMKKRQILLIRDEENRVESDNMQRDETICGTGIKGCSPLWGQGPGYWISAMAECRFSPTVLTSGCESSAHIHLFNLGKLHLMSYIVHWVKEQWVPLYSIVPPWPSGVVLYGYDQCFVPLSPCVLVFYSGSVITWQNMIMVFKKSISCWLPGPVVVCPVVTFAL